MPDLQKHLHLIYTLSHIEAYIISMFSPISFKFSYIYFDRIIMFLYIHSNNVPNDELSRSKGTLNLNTYVARMELYLHVQNIHYFTPFENYKEINRNSHTIFQ